LTRIRLKVKIRKKRKVAVLNSFAGLGKALLLIGLILAVIGGGLLLLPKIPWLGKLPGDIFYKGEKITFYFPLTTSIIISIILTLLFSIFRK
jgi:hypothetical protein